METKEFKAESKRLLDLMINSIYTHKEIFLRELISNASDAIDKLYFKSLTDDKVGIKKDDFAINIKLDKDARTITISDNGIGMTKEELENHLGTIANSGSFKFKNENKLEEDVDIIGQFGVGFYSAFMVAKEVTVRSKAYGSDQAYEWISEGAEGYQIGPCAKDNVGTEIILTLKDNTDDENYDEFLEQYRIQTLIKKYSDYIRFPIKMDMTKSRLKEGTESEYEDYTETETLNSMIPIWRKNKSELKDEDYNSFYKEKFFDYTDPILHIHTKTEGTATYNALLYIPSKAPYDYYSKEYEKGLQLYSSGVLIMDKCADLLPDHFSFVKGLVDSEDLSLNISREMLQHDRQLKLIAKSLERTIKNELTKLLKNDRDKYEEFYKAFGLQLKFGVYNNYGMNKDDMKSDRIWAKGYIVREACTTPSNWRCEETLDSFLKKNNTIGIEGIDTRHLTRIIRESGVMNGAILTTFDPADPANKAETEALLAEIRAYAVTDAVKNVTCAAPEVFNPEGETHIVLMHYGCKRNIVRCLVKRGCKVTVMPAFATAEEIKALAPDGIMLSNGPGDPAEPVEVIENLKHIFELNIPTFGICLGHQLSALAAGAKTMKLKYGHRGANQPVTDFESGRTFITSQNHGYAVVGEELPAEMGEVAQVNANDGTCEGIKYKKWNCFTVQFHPEANGGPKDTEFLFDRFLNNVKAAKKEAR